MSVVASMSHTKLSMIASHLAAGGFLCCLEGQSWVRTVTSVREELLSLDDFAYEALGCSHAIDLPFLIGGKPCNDRERAAVRRVKRYLNKFLEIV